MIYKENGVIYETSTIKDIDGNEITVSKKCPIQTEIDLNNQLERAQRQLEFAQKYLDSLLAIKNAEEKTIADVKVELASIKASTVAEPLEETNA